MIDTRDRNNSAPSRPAIRRTRLTATITRPSHEARIGAGEFDRVVDGFLTELEQQSGEKRRQPDRYGVVDAAEAPTPRYAAPVQ